MQAVDLWCRTLLPRMVLAPTQLGKLIRSALAILLGLVLAAGILITSTMSLKMMVLAVGAMMAPFLAMVVGNLRYVMLAGIMLEMTYPFDSYMNYQERYAAFGSIGGFNISLTTIFIIGLYALWFTEILSRRGPLAHYLPHISMPHFLYLGAMVLSLTMTHNVALSIFEINLVFQVFLVYTYIVSTVRTKEEVVFLVKILMLALLLQGFLMVLVRGVGHTITLGVVELRIDPTTQRVGGSVGSYNGASNYLMTFGIMALVFFLTIRERLYQRLALLAFLISIVGILLTQSRGGLIAFVMAFALLCLLGIPRGWVPKRLPVIAASVALFATVAMGPILFARFTSDDGGSAESRLPLAQIAWDMVEDHPVLGVGANNFAFMMPEYITPEFAAAWLYTVHNKYLLVWSETGTIGLVAFMLIPFSIIYQAIRCWATKNMDPFLGLLAVGFGACTIGLIFHMQFDIFNGRPQVMTLWLSSAFTTTICHMYATASEPVPVRPPQTGRRISPQTTPLEQQR